METRTVKNILWGLAGLFLVLTIIFYVNSIKHVSGTDVANTQMTVFAGAAAVICAINVAGALIATALESASYTSSAASPLAPRSTPGHGTSTEYRAQPAPAPATSPAPAASSASAASPASPAEPARTPAPEKLSSIVSELRNIPDIQWTDAAGYGELGARMAEAGLCYRAEEWAPEGIDGDEARKLGFASWTLEGDRKRYFKYRRMVPQISQEDFERIMAG